MWRRSRVSDGARVVVRRATRAGRGSTFLPLQPLVIIMNRLACLVFSMEQVALMAGAYQLRRYRLAEQEPLFRKGFCRSSYTI